MNRRQNFQTISWFWDLRERNRLNLEPPYQRRSVWNQTYKNEFIETILFGYPAPAIFLYEEIEPSGISRYNVVDGKQRLTTLFEFASDEFTVTENSTLSSRGKYFGQLSRDEKTAFWAYQFSVEYLPNVDEVVLNDIFNRINKNVAKLSRQELRHARHNGPFITACETLADALTRESPEFPRIVTQSRNQMKDVELVAQLLLFLEEHQPRGYSQDELDDAFAARDEEWPAQSKAEGEFRAVSTYITGLLAAPNGSYLRGSRLRNQIDYYSLFGAVAELSPDRLPSAADGAQALESFIRAVEDESARSGIDRAKKYFDAARSAANDTGARKTRIEIVRDILIGAS